MGTPAVRLAFVIAFGVVAWGARRSTRGRRLDRLEQWAGAHGYRPAELPRGAATAMLRQRPRCWARTPCRWVRGTGTLCDFTISTADGDVEVTAVVASARRQAPPVRCLRSQAVRASGPAGHLGRAGRPGHPVDARAEGRVSRVRGPLPAAGRQGSPATWRWRSVFTPELVEWWADQGDSGPSFEYEDGTMTVARRRCSDSAAELDRLLAQASSSPAGSRPRGPPTPEPRMIRLRRRAPRRETP